MSTPVVDAKDPRCMLLACVDVLSFFLAMHVCHMHLGNIQDELWSFLMISPIAILFARFFIGDKVIYVLNRKEHKTFGSQILMMMHKGLRSGAIWTIVFAVIVYIYVTFFG